MIIDIIFFAIIAVFIFIRLFDQFGKITPNDSKRQQIIDSILKKNKKENKGVVIDITEKKKETEKFEKEKTPINVLNPLEKSISEILGKIKGLTLKQFLSGAEKAMEMTIDAFSKQNTKSLELLLSRDLFSQFEKEIEKRKKKEQKLTSSIVSIVKQEIVNAKMIGRFAVIDIQFISEQINCIKDKKNKVISGNLKDIQTITEVWSFRKDITTKDPNWKIVGISNLGS